MTLLVTFTWEEDGAMSYDQLMDQLMHLGADDIETEEYVPPVVMEPSGRRKKPKVGEQRAEAAEIDALADSED